MKIQLDSIKGKKIFDFVFESGQRFFETNSMAVVCFNSTVNELNKIYYSVSVPKRSAKKAVVRNRIKRLMRESIRLFFTEYLNSHEFCPISHISLIWRNAPVHPALICLNDVNAEVSSLISKALSFNNKKGKAASNL